MITDSITTNIQRQPRRWLLGGSVCLILALVIGVGPSVTSGNDSSNETVAPSLHIVPLAMPAIVVRAGMITYSGQCYQAAHPDGSADSRQSGTFDGFWRYIRINDTGRVESGDLGVVDGISRPCPKE